MDPDTAAGHLERALQLEREGRAEDAVKSYQEAVALDPAAADAYIRMGLLLRGLGRDEEANAAFDAALALRADAASASKPPRFDPGSSLLRSRP